MRSRIAAAGLVLAAGTASAQTPTPTVTPSKVDWARLATVVVGRWQLAPGEKAVLFWDRASDRGAAEALRKAITAKGGVVAGEIDVAQPRDDAAWARTFAQAD